jgi:hypothetical protein
MAVLDKIKLNDMKMEIADEKTRIIETGVNKQESAEKWVVRVLLLAIVSLAIIRIGGWMRED